MESGRFSSKSEKGESFHVDTIAVLIDALSYDPNANQGPDGDNDGTTIQLTE